MNSREPKVAARVCGRPMAARVIGAMREAGASRIIAVVGHRARDVKAVLGGGVEYVTQRDQLGTGHAVACAAGALAGYTGPVLVGYADIPLLTHSDIARLVGCHVRTGASATLLTAELGEPGTLGRVLRSADGQVDAIVEARDASAEELKIREINVGVYCFTVPLLFDMLAQIRDDNAQRQYYLTDVIGLLVGRGDRVEAVPMERPDRGLGVDTTDDLARAELMSRGLPDEPGGRERPATNTGEGRACRRGETGADEDTPGAQAGGRGWGARPRALMALSGRLTQL